MEISFKVVDYVLRFLATNPKAYSYDITASELQKEIVKENPEMDDPDNPYLGSDLQDILDRLVDDGYVFKQLRPFEPKDGEPQIAHYRIKLAGKFFIKDGGYSSKRDREQESLIEAEKAAKEARGLALDLFQIQKNMNRLTWWLVFGAVGLLAFEVAKFLLEKWHKIACP